MKYGCSLRALHWLGVVTALASLPTTAIGQAANPLGVEWVGGNAATNPPPPATNNPLGVEWAGGGKDASGPAAVPATNNPLGVEWVGGGKDASGPAPAPTTSNPLGVEWVGGGKDATRPAPTDGVGTPPKPSPTTRPPAPVEPSPAPQRPSPQPTAPVAPPRPGTSQSGLAAALIDVWAYQAVAFSSGNGTVSETRGVSGTLKFKPDGQYEQALYIGGIANVMKGSYRITGGRLETTYLWRGESITDSFDLYLDPAGKQLTLMGLGSPKSYYTLQRME